MEAKQLWLSLGSWVLRLVFLWAAVHFFVHWRSRTWRGVPHWSISAVDFALIVCVCLMLFALLPQAVWQVAEVLHWSETVRKLAAGSSSHVGIIMAVGALLIFRREWMGYLWGEGLSVSGLLGQVCYHLGALMPVVWLVSKSWEWLLQRLEDAGWLSFAKQDLLHVLAGLDSPWQTAGFLLMAVVLAPISEELLFRGLIYRFLRGRMGLAAAMALSGFLFAGLHANLFAFVSLWVIGVALALFYEKTGDLRVAMGVHALFNLSSCVTVLLFPELL